MSYAPQIVLKLIDESRPPEHQKLNTALQEMMDGVLDALLEDPEFTLAPILEKVRCTVLHLLTFSKCNELISQLNVSSINIYSLFLEACRGRWDALDEEGSQVALITCITAFLDAFSPLRIRSLPQSVSEAEKSVLSAAYLRVDECFKGLFRQAGEAGRVTLVNQQLLMAQQCPQLDRELLLFMWRNYAKSIGGRLNEAEVYSTAHSWAESMFLGIKNLSSTEEADLKFFSNTAACLQVLLRHSLRGATQLPLSLLQLLIRANWEVAKQFKNSTVAEMRDRRPRLLKDIFQLLSERGELLESVEDEELVWAYARENRNVPLPKSVINSDRIGRLLVGSGPLNDALFEGEIKPQSSALFLEQVLRRGWSWKGLLSLAKRAVVNDSVLIKKRLLLAVRLALMSRGTDELYDIFREELGRKGIQSMEALLLASCMPFSLLKSTGERTQILDGLVEELIFKYRTCKEAPIVILLGEALANLVGESVDSLKHDKITLIMGLISGISTPRLAHQIIRPLLQVKDERVWSLLDWGVLKANYLEAGQFLRLLPFVKTLKDPERTAKLVGEKFDRLVPRLVAQMPVESNPLLRHWLLHALYTFLKYSLDVTCISRPFLQQFTERVAVYAQGFLPAWSKGEFEGEAEDGIWGWLEGQQQRGSVEKKACKVIGGVLVSGGGRGAALRAAMRSLQQRVDVVIGKGDEEVINHLCATIQSLLN